jgi:hypothetical protein
MYNYSLLKDTDTDYIVLRCREMTINSMDRDNDIVM